MIIKDHFHSGINFSCVLGKYYVYIYADPDTQIPFYVGKGKNLRRFHHLKNSSLEKDSNKAKVNKIKTILIKGKNPLIYLFKEFLQEETAYFLEDLLIQLIGRIHSKDGPLTNIGIGLRGSDTISKHPNKKNICEKISNTLKNKYTLKEYTNPMCGKKGKDHPAFGLKHSKDSIIKRSLKLSEFLKKTGKRKGKNNPMFDKKHSQETKDLLSIKAKSRGQSFKLNPNAKKYTLNSISGVSITVIGSLKDFCIKNNLSYGMFGKLCRNEIKEYRGWTLEKYL